MTERSRAIVRWEFLGAVFMILTGAALHFLYEWTGGWRPSALIAAVNESVWEHLKLAFWPGLFWALAPRPGLGLRLRSRLAARGYSLLLTAALIVGVFTAYTAILGRNLLVLDIGTFAVAILAGQLVAAVFNIRGRGAPAVVTLGLVLLTAQLTAYSVLTFHAPNLWLFVDGHTGLPGTPAVGPLR